MWEFSMYGRFVAVATNSYGEEKEVFWSTFWPEITGFCQTGKWEDPKDGSIWNLRIEVIETWP